METDGTSFESAPFSYDILDQEAAKISSLMLAVQQLVIKGGERIAADLFQWAEQCHQAGRRHEAEFLYLHAINHCDREKGAVYPIAFTGLREFAQMLIDRSRVNQPVRLEPDAAMQHLDAAA